MDESYGTYVDDEYYDNHDYDDNTDDYTDDDTDDDIGHKGYSSTATGAAPDAGAAPTHTRPNQTRPGQARPDQTQKKFMLTLFWPERASYNSCEVLDTSIRKLVTTSSVLDGSQPILEGLRGVHKGSKVGPWGGFWTIVG